VRPLPQTLLVEFAVMRPLLTEIQQAGDAPDHSEEDFNDVGLDEIEDGAKRVWWRWGGSIRQPFILEDVLSRLCGTCEWVAQYGLGIISRPDDRNETHSALHLGSKALKGRSMWSGNCVQFDVEFASDVEISRVKELKNQP